MQEERRRQSEIISGLFIVLAILLFALFAFNVGHWDPLDVLKGRTLACRARFLNIRTLDVGAKVTVAGRRVGVVTGLRFVDQPVAADTETLRETLPPEFDELLVPSSERQYVEVQFDLDEPSLALDPGRAIVSLTKDGLLGTHHLALEPGIWEKGARPRSIFETAFEEPVAIRSVPGAEIDDILIQVKAMGRQLTRLFDVTEKDVLTHDNIQALGDTVENIRDLTGSARTALDRIESTLAPDDPEGLHVLVIKPLSELIAEVNRTVSGLEGHLTSETLARLDSLLGEGQSILASVRGTEEEPGLPQLVKNVTRATADLDVKLDRLTGDVGNLLQHSDQLVVENRAEIKEAIRRLRRSLWQTELAVRKIRSDPSLLLWGDNEPDLEAEGFDEGGLRRSGRARPYEQRDETDDRR